MLEQLPRARRPPAGAGGGRRGGRALRRRGGRVAADLGSMGLHRKLEHRLAAFKGAEAALLFGSGYLANVGRRHRAHGPRPGRLLRRAQPRQHHRRVPALPSGDVRLPPPRHRAPRVGAAPGRRPRGARGHRRGVLDGRRRRAAGRARRARPPPRVHARRRRGARRPARWAPADAARSPRPGSAARSTSIVGTLGKALGSYGAYVCGSRQLVELLVNAARPFIYSTAPPPPSVGAALAALGLLAERPGLVEQLRRNAATLRQGLSAQGLDAGSSRTQIVPVMVGDARRAMALSERTLEAGVFAQAIRPPTVPPGGSRLRLTVMANHRADELTYAAAAIAGAARGLGLPGRRFRARAAPRGLSRQPLSRRRARARPRARGGGRPRRPRSGRERRAW